MWENPAYARYLSIFRKILHMGRRASYVVILDEFEKVLLLKYAKKPEYPMLEHKFVIPGGGAEAGELPEETGKRETYEETGINLEALSKIYEGIVEFYSKDYDVTIFASRKPPGDIKISPEHEAYIFGDRHELDGIDFADIHIKDWIQMAYEMLG